MAVLTLLVHLPLALDGEAATGNNSTLDALFAVSMVFGYVALFALWWFVFRDKERARRKRKSSD